MKTDIADILSANSRLPNSLYGDLNGQINALDLGEGRLHELLDEYTEKVFQKHFELKKRAEKMMSDHLLALPDGQYLLKIIWITMA